MDKNDYILKIFIDGATEEEAEKVQAYLIGLFENAPNVTVLGFRIQEVESSDGKNQDN